MTSFTNLIRNIGVLSLLLLSILSNNAYAASGDSVMTAPGTTEVPSMIYKTATTSSGNVYSYTSTTQYQTSTCPVGLTVNGSSIYNSAQRQIIYMYLGSELVNTQTTAWIDIDTDCTGTQTQTIACPTGYNGTITQQRKIATATGGYVSGDWTTTGSSCVAARVCQYSDNTSYAMYWSNLSTWMNWNGGNYKQQTTIGMSFNDARAVLNSWGYDFGDLVNYIGDHVGSNGLYYYQICKL